MRKTLIAGNWKMHGTRDFVRDLLLDLKENLDGHPSDEALKSLLTTESTFDGSTKSLDQGAKSSKFNQLEVAVMPPFIFLPQASDLLEDSMIALGAQNVADAIEGALTGEISAKMLHEFGCEYVIIGHSERRLYYGETDALIAKKLVLATGFGLKPILCVGEKLEEREQEITETVIAKQLQAILALDNVHEVLAKAVIAYEPVWAIGTGLTATPQQAQQVHLFIREQLKEKVPALAEQIRIIYGGSVKPNNAADLMIMPDIDGFLVGGASLKAQEFLEICRCNK